MLSVQQLLSVYHDRASKIQSAIHAAFEGPDKGSNAAHGSVNQLWTDSGTFCILDQIFIVLIFTEAYSTPALAPVKPADKEVGKDIIKSRNIAAHDLGDISDLHFEELTVDEAAKATLEEIRIDSGMLSFSIM